MVGWYNPPELDVTRHKVERRKGTTGNFEVVREQNRKSESYGDHSVEPNTLYQYRVYIGDGNGLGDYVEIQETSEELAVPEPPTNFRVTNATFTNGVYQADSDEPELDWDVDDASTGNRLTRKLIDPPAGVECDTPGNCPTLELMRQEGTRNTGYTDIYNGGGQYQYWIRSIGRDGELGDATRITVQVPAPTLPQQAAPTNAQFTTGRSQGAMKLSARWEGHEHNTAYLVQWRRHDESYNPDETGGRSTKNVVSNPLNMYFADGKTFQPASTAASRTYGRNATPPPWDTVYYMRVGTCADRDCAIADVLFAAEKTARSEPNPYD